MVGVIPHQRRQIKGHRQTCLCLFQEILESLIRLFGGAIASKHPHGPDPAAIHRGIDAAGERIQARETEILDIVEIAEIARRVKPSHRMPRDRVELLRSLG